MSVEMSTVLKTFFMLKAIVSMLSYWAVNRLNKTSC